MTSLLPDDEPAEAGSLVRRVGRREGTGVLLAFVAVAALSAAMVLIDLNSLLAARSDPFVTASPRVVRMARPEPDNQIRPYLPAARPIDPGSAGDAEAIRHRRQVPDEAAPMTFRIGADRTLIAEGTIVPGTHGTLERLLAASAGADGAPSRIVLHSPGGSVRDAIAMARLIRRLELATSVAADGYCASSCPLVFAGGVKRTASREAWIGVHQVYAEDSELGSLQQGMDEAQRVSAQAQALLVELGVDPRLWIRAMQTPKDRLYLLTPQELTSFRLATAIDGAS